MADSNPKLCECGCGHPAPIAKFNNRARGHVKGQPLRFCSGHSSRGYAYGLSKTRAYGIWQQMIERCYNKSNKYYARYGGRGITVCPEWRNNVRAFVNDMGMPPKGKMLDRIDNNGPYCKENCRWITAKEQANNTSRNRLITAFGKTQTLQQWADETGIKAMTIKERLNSGWSNERALSDPKEWTLTDLAKEMGIKPSTLSERIRRGWSLSRAVHQPTGKYRYHEQ